jgi:hypothetical protein
MVKQMSSPTASIVEATEGAEVAAGSTPPDMDVVFRPGARRMRPGGPAGPGSLPGGRTMAPATRAVNLARLLHPGPVRAGAGRRDVAPTGSRE